MLNNRKRIVGIVVIFVVIASIVAGLVLVKRNQDIREKAAPATSIYISPPLLGKVRGAGFTSLVKIDTGVNRVSAVDVRVNFNPAAIEIVSITKGAALGNFTDQGLPMNGINNTTGKITYLAYTLDRTKAVTGTGLEVLKITGRVKATAAFGDYPLSFGTETALSGVDETQNVVVSKTQGIIRVMAATPISTVSPTTPPQRTATPTPVRTPTIRPTATPIRTPTVRPTATPVRTPTTPPQRTATPTAVPTPTTPPQTGPGDVDGSGKVDIVDVGLLIDNYRILPIVDQRCDLNNDGAVDIADIGILVDNYGNQY